MTEADLAEAVRALAQMTGWRRYHTYNSRGSAHGWPDEVLARPPQLLVRELKTDTGRVTVAQQGWLDALAECGVDVGVWRPEDLRSGRIARELNRRGLLNPGIPGAVLGGVVGHPQVFGVP